MNALDRFFKISERGSTIRTEVLAGLTTFVTMAYLIFVQPAILSPAAWTRRGAGRHLPFGRDRERGDGTVRQLPDRWPRPWARTSSSRSW